MKINIPEFENKLCQISFWGIKLFTPFFLTLKIPFLTKNSHEIVFKINLKNSIILFIAAILLRYNEINI